MAEVTAEARGEPAPAGENGLAAGTIVADRYRVLGLLGTGGMGTVYRAEHVRMRKTVALKVLHRELLGVGEIVARFEREAIAAGRIDHPNVAAASDFGKLDDGSYYLVLEYVDGQSLRALLDRGALSHAQALDITRQTAHALRAAHELGIVHRDLKPDNVMLVTEPDGRQRVKVLDFGIARVTLPDAPADATHLTRVGVIMGTVAYMSPEQALGQGVDGRSDLYSLGVMLHEMITGQPPFQAEFASQVLARQLTEPPPPLPAHTPPVLAALVADLLEKSASKRPPHAADVIARLDALAVTPSGRVAAPKALSKHTLWWVAAGVGLFVAALALLGVLASEQDESRVSREPPASGTAPHAVLPHAGSKPSAAVKAPATPPSVSAVPAAAKSEATNAPKRKSAPTGEAGRPKKRTGPGGIYIPPPDEWFKR